MAQTTKKTPLIGIYARQSVSQDEGIVQQLQACHDEAARRGWRVVDEYDDNAVSASKARGPKSDWVRMLRDIDAGRIDTVLVVAVDRLLRRIVDVIEIKNRKVRVVVVRGGIDTAEPYGSFTVSMLVLLAEQELEIKAARAVPYRAERHKRGLPSSGRPPFGYRWLPAIERGENPDVRWKLEPVEAAAVKLMFHEALATKKTNLFAIVQKLNAGDVKPPSGGERWHSSTVRRMLLNPSFAGLLAPATTRDQREVEGYNHHAESVSIDDCTPGNWEAIVTEDQVRAVRARLTDSARATNTGQTARKWLLGGLATCSVCRVPVRSARTREGHHGYRCPAGHFLRRGEVIDAFVVAGVLKRLSEPDAETLLQPPPPDIDVPALHARREALQAKRAELLKLVGTFTAAQVEQETVPIDAELDDIAVTLAKVMEADPLAEILSAPDLLAFWRGLSLARQRDIVDALAMVVIAPVGKGRKMDSFGAVATSVLLDWHSNPGAGVLASDGPMTDETFDALRSALG